ncbi:MAG TPA: hypothetical protein VKG80_14205 [Trebonia sp.]|nr:hypothetical protein [Trebonia sp.]
MAGIFLWANTLVPKSGGTAEGASSPSASAPVSASPTGAATAAAAVTHGVFAGRGSGDQAVVVIEVDGPKAAAEVTSDRHLRVDLQGSVHGNQLTLSGPGGVGLTGTVSGPDVFGTITGFRGQTFPFSAASESVRAVYAGHSSGNEVALAVDTDGSKATGYVCNGKTVEAWLQGSVKGDQVTLTGKNGANLTGTLSGLAMFGTVAPKAGVSFPFSAELAPRPAGIFQARLAVNRLATRIGWAVLPDGTQFGVSVTGTTASPAPPLDLGDDSFVMDGTTFTAAPVDGDATVVSP